MKAALRVLAIALIAVVFAGGTERRPVTIQDCIQLVRIQQTYDADDPTVVFSNDGRRFLTMVWHGDLQKNLNEYTVLLFDAEHLEKPPKDLLTVSFSYDSIDQHSRPLKQFAFLADNRLVALATFHGEPRQVVAIDLRANSVAPLTQHPGGVLAFAATPDGQAVVYAAKAPADEKRKAALYRDGFSLEDRQAVEFSSLSQVAVGDWFEPATQYFLISKPGAPPRKIHDASVAIFRRVSAASYKPVFWMSPDGQRAVVHPWAEATGGKPTFGLIDMRTGTIERLVPADAPSFGHVLWARDSRSLLVSASPLGGGPATLYDIDLSTRRILSAPIGEGGEWDLLGWNAEGNGVILARGGHPRSGDPQATMAMLRRTASGWDRLNPLLRAESNFDLNSRYYSGTNGHLIVGVRDTVSDPPELAAYDVESRRTRVLTQLNPQVGDLKLGEVTRIRWTSRFDKETSFGYLIKPVDYVSGKKYPLIIQFKDEGYYPEDNSFVFDGLEQYSGAAIQVWANQGFVVLFTPAPRSLREVMESPKEDERITAHIESALDMLDGQGLIDRNKVAISGWSRAGWWTEYVVTHATSRFAAASTIDNVEYNLNQYVMRNREYGDYLERHWGGALPWGNSAERWREQAIDFKYDKAQTPRLIELHGASRAVFYAEMYAALKTAKIPVDFYIYPDAPHSLKSPLHRLHSLSAHTDWFRFWLQDYEDPSAEKQSEYARWRRMREDWHAARAALPARPSSNQ